MEERLIRFRPRAILVVIGIVLSTALMLELVWVTRGVLIWILVAAFLATALNPAVEWVQAHGVARRGVAVGIVYVLTLLAIVGISATFIPTLINEVNDFAEAVPDYVDDLTSGQGRLGFLEREYQVVEKIREAIETSGASGLFGLSSTALSVTKSVLNTIVAIITIAFLTLFMLLEGPNWVERILGLVPDRHEPRVRRIGVDVYRTIGGYVAGNLAISVLAGALSAVLLLVLGVPYAIALGLIVGLLDLIPLAGATIAAVIVSSIAFVDSTRNGAIVLVFFVLYQQLENHVIQPLVYGRTVQLSPLAVLVAVLIGAELAGILGALGAIPVAGAIQVLLRDWLSTRGSSDRGPPEPAVDTVP